MLFKNHYLIFFLALFIVNTTAFAEKNSPQKCVQIYYDSVPNAADKYYLGRIYTISLQNLISHFIDIQPYIIPIEDYKKGQIERCYASIYLGSYYDNKLPNAFINDFVTTKKNVMWIDNNISSLSPYNLKNIWGAQNLGIVGMDYEKRESNGIPGSYKYFIYKGEIFTYEIPKAQLDKDIYARNIYAFNIPNLKQQQDYIVAWAQHSTRNTTIPYVLRNKNHWYVASNPFNYMANDKYLIFADVLFDVLNEQPVDRGKKFALIRIEDVHPKTKPEQIRALTDLFAKNKIPFAIALIPDYKDPFGVYNKGVKEEVKLSDKTNFLRALNYAKQHGASFILHGVTHQYDATKNPYSGISGEDFEFWAANAQGPLNEDSPTYVLNLLTSGYTMAQAAGFKPAAWLTPHYAASALDYVIFGQLFLWNVGQVKYTLANICQNEKLPEKFSFDIAGINAIADKIRRDNFAKMKVTSITSFNFDSGEPYVVYRDFYGQRLIPDYLGHILPWPSEGVITIRTPEDILADAKRNLVLRDVWASFAFHTMMLNTIDKGGLAKKPGDMEELQKMITALKADGYIFVDLKKWTQEHQNDRAPVPIEVGPYAPKCSY
jgi:uncharacterized protein YdaL